MYCATSSSELDQGLDLGSIDGAHALKIPLQDHGVTSSDDELLLALGTKKPRDLQPLCAGKETIIVM